MVRNPVEGSARNEAAFQKASADATMRAEGSDDNVPVESRIVVDLPMSELLTALGEAFGYLGYSIEPKALTLQDGERRFAVQVHGPRARLDKPEEAWIQHVEFDFTDYSVEEARSLKQDFMETLARRSELRSDDAE